jgi:NAD(P)-dependent dehydrogenase (short-subunit alcohol dehydrogenase family)
VNCAATIALGEKLVDTPVEAIQKEIGTNVLGNFYTIKEFLPDMLRMERGHIVTVSSALGFCGPARLSNSPLISNLSRVLIGRRLRDLKSSPSLPPRINNS